MSEGDGPEPRRQLIAERYRVDGLLGRGGMSEVHHGYDERLDRAVAIKLLRPPANVPAAPDSPEAVEILDALDRDRKRFLREIRVTAHSSTLARPLFTTPGCRLRRMAARNCGSSCNCCAVRPWKHC